jgi:hypothetical protein
MSVMRVGYGSEWHLRSLLAAEPARVEEAILSALKADGVVLARSIIWHPTYLKLETPEVCGLDFLERGSQARMAWKSWWPQSGTVHNWDAVATLCHQTGQKEWLLIEAKANLQEVESNCGAKEHGGLALIRLSLRTTQLACGIADERDWTKGHYQLANRLALLHFLRRSGVAARLIFIYFIGDRGNARRDCPASREPWDRKLGEVRSHLGLTGKSDLEKNLHEVFLCVEPGIGTRKLASK